MALGPVIDEKQRDKVHSLVTSSIRAGARLAAGGTYEGLFYRPTVLAGVSPEMPAYAQEVFGPVAPVITFSDVDQAVALARTRSTGCPWAFSAPTSRALAIQPTASPAASCTSTTRRSATRRSRRSAG